MEDKKPRAAVKRRAFSEKKLRKLALDTMIDMVNDTDLKPSDRLNAIKALLDFVDKQAPKSEDGVLNVIFENLPDGFAD